MKRKVFFAAFAILVLCLTQWASGIAWAAPFSTGRGDGTSLDPYVIATGEDLDDFAKEVNSGTNTKDIFYILTTDIDLPEGTNWQPIGTVENPFKGNFDGEWNTINGLHVNRLEKSVGLFGSTRNATIKRLGVKISLLGVNGNGSNNYVGGLVGYQYNGRIENCYVTGTTSGDVFVGEVRGNGSGNFVGGLVGYQDVQGGTSTIENCYAAGNVRSNRVGNVGRAGGLVGYKSVQYSSTSTIKNSYATGNVEGNYAGGLVGDRLAQYSSESIIENCYATGHVNGDHAKGLVGYESNFESTNSITDCYRGDFVQVNGQDIVDKDPSGLQGGTVTTKQLQTQETYEGKDGKRWKFDVNSWRWNDKFLYPYLGFAEEDFRSYPFPCANIIGPTNQNDKTSTIIKPIPSLVEGYYSLAWSGFFRVLGTAPVEVDVTSGDPNIFSWDTRAQKLNMKPGLKAGNKYFIELTARNYTGSGGKATFELNVVEPPKIEGEGSLVLPDDYKMTSTDVFEVRGKVEVTRVYITDSRNNPSSEVEVKPGEEEIKPGDSETLKVVKKAFAKIQWNEEKNKLDIREGIDAAITNEDVRAGIGTYFVDLEATNDTDRKVPFTFTLKVIKKPTITNGPTSLTLPQNYTATSTSPYTVGGTPTVTVGFEVDEDHDDKIRWDNNSKRLYINAGLTPKTYTVTLTASNELTASDPIKYPAWKLEFTLIVTAPAKIIEWPEPMPMTLREDYKTTSTGDFKFEGTEPIKVTLTVANDPEKRIMWNENTKRLDIIAGLKVGNYDVVLTPSNIMGEGEKFTFTLTVTPPVAPVTSVTIDPPTTQVKRGSTHTFTAIVHNDDGKQHPVQDVTWTVEGSTESSITTGTTGGVLTVAADETAGHLIVRATSVADPQQSGTALVIVPTIDPNNNATINGEPMDLTDSTNGTGWEWNVNNKTMTVTGDLNGGVVFTVNNDIKINVTTHVTMGGIANKGTGKLTITAPSQGLGRASETSLNIDVAIGSAISAMGEIEISSGEVTAVTHDESAPAIVSTGNSVTINGSAIVTAHAFGDGSAISAEKDINISTSGEVHAITEGAGYSLEADAIKITNGTTKLDYVEGNGKAYNINPVISGDNTKVSANGDQVWPKAGDAPTITSANSTTVTSGTGGTFQVTADGTQPITYSLTGAPAGVSIGSSNGMITVAATVAANTYRFNIIASNEAGEGTQEFTLTVDAAPVGPVAPEITSENHTTVTSGTGGTFQVTATGNPSTFVYSLTGAPAGVSIGSSNGVIAITAAVAVGSHTFTITASNGVAPDATQSFTLIVNAAPVGPVAPTITSANSTRVTSGTGGTFQVTATGSPTIVYSLTGAPAGVSIEPSTGVITVATTVAVGSHTFTITASNGVAPNATQSFTLTVTSGNVVVEDEGGSGSCDGFGAGMSMAWALLLFPLLATRKGKKAN